MGLRTQPLLEGPLKYNKNLNCGPTFIEGLSEKSKETFDFWDVLASEQISKLIQYTTSIYTIQYTTSIFLITFALW